MDCNETRKQLHEYLDHALGEADARAIEHHLDSCPTCRKEFEALSKLDLALRAEPWREPPGDLAATVVRRLGRRLAYSWRDVAVAAAAVAIVLGLAWLFAPLLETALLGGGSEPAPPPIAELLRVDVGGLTFSYADLRDFVLEGYAATSSAVAETRGISVGGIATVILLIVSAMLAMGTNAVCYRQAQMRHMRENRL